AARGVTGGGNGGVVLSGTSVKWLARIADRWKEAAQPGAAVALLRAAGCEEQLDGWNLGWVSRKVENPATDLPRIRKAIGRLQLAGKELVNARRRLVEVTLRAVDYPSVHVRYETRMPRRKRCGRPPRCRIVTQVRRVSRL